MFIILNLILSIEFMFIILMASINIFIQKFIM